MARDLLVLHLQHENEHRPSASSLKENMLNQLASAGRHVVHMLAEASAAEVQAAADTFEVLMTPRHISVPSGLEKTLESMPPQMAQQAHAHATSSHLNFDAGNSGSVVSSKSEVSSIFGSESRPMSHAGLEQSPFDGRMGPQHSTPVLSSIKSLQSPMPVPSDNTTPAASAPGPGMLPTAMTLFKFSPAPAQDASAPELGIKLVAGEAGEMGAWKISELEPGKPAALSNEIKVAEYLWEIDGKVIFGMPCQFISTLFRGKPGCDVRLGLKAGLGLPIRHVALSREGSAPSAEPATTSAAPSTAASTTETQVQDKDTPKTTTPVDQTAAPSAAVSHKDTKMDTNAAAPKAAETPPSIAAPKEQAAAAAPPPKPLSPSLPPVSKPLSPVLPPQVATPEMRVSTPIARGGSVDGSQRDAAVVERTSLSPQALPMVDNSKQSPSTLPSIPSSEVPRQSPLLTAVPTAAPADKDVATHSGNKAPATDAEQAKRSPGVRAIETQQPRHSPLARPADIDLGAANAARFAHDWRTGGAGPAEKPALPADTVEVAVAPVAVVGVATIAGDGEYSGELIDGKPFGRGTATWPNQGHTYVGEWRGGVMHGQGTATYLNGDRYDGEWVQGKRSGLGRYAHGSGDVYEGQWSNERKHGLGVDTFADGRGYRGEFRDNKFAGIGSYFTVDGAVYQVKGTVCLCFCVRVSVSVSVSVCMR